MTTPRRRWPSYSLRTLLVVVTVSGAITGWLIQQREVVRQRLLMRSEIESQGAWVISTGERIRVSDWCCRSEPSWLQSKLAERQEQRHSQSTLPLLRLWLGDQYIEGICLTESLSARREEMARLFPE